eukprot:gnl/TRDRNA2_/TRDRNA2_132566_c0_seq3.p1 gnl/TRDRNA2_/TRDRNA2_132566_c0~~gnl/TRDRNA2_/TRDRNA2_132566_c0_seq3.p1  ORF type:complete len:266 (+),score=64.15 gnl/TRDRNA2_/TRDRNA2_132566_c0_seq3:85-882(+)
MSGDYMAFFRITVLGSANSGKTALINTWVNNFCPTAYTPTLEPQLYYRMVRVAMREESNEKEPSDQEEVISALVELEDTHSSKAAGEDPQKTVETFMDMTHKDPREVLRNAKSQAVESVWPVACYRAPAVDKHAPMTKGRMAFLILYDVNDEQSFASAKEVQSSLTKEVARQKSKLQPVVYLVANKIDKEPLGSEYQRLKHAGQALAGRNKIQFAEVSALEYKRVRKLFSDVLKDVSRDPALWQLGWEQKAKTQGNGTDENCSVQ